MDLVRRGIAAASTSSNHDAAFFAEGRWGAHSPAAIGLKAAAGATDNWAADLVASAGSAGREFLGAVIAESLLGIPGLRHVPPRVRCVALASGVSAEWRGEGQAGPISALALAAEELPIFDLGVQAVLTRETLTAAGALGEQLVRSVLIAAVVEAVNEAFIDPSNAGVPHVRPASITHDLAPVSADAESLHLALDLFGGDLSRAVWITSPKTAAALHGALLHPGIGLRGGELLGAPVHVTGALPFGDLALVDPTGIAWAGAAEAEIAGASDATVEMVPAPLGDSIEPVATEMVSLWQTGSTAIRATQSLGWTVARPGSVVRLELFGAAS